MSLTRSDPEYLRLKAKGRQPIKVRASDVVAFLDIAIDLQDENERLKALTTPQPKAERDEP